MSQGKTATKNIVINNKPSVIVSKTVELVVVNDALVPDKNETEHGVNSKNLKN